MGMVRLWDGNDLPDIGSEVLAHLSSCNAWVRHVVTGYRVTKDNKSQLCRVEIVLGPSKDKRSTKNSRLYGDILPVHAVEVVAQHQKELLDEYSKEIAKKKEEVDALMDRLEGTLRLSRMRLREAPHLSGAFFY